MLEGSEQLVARYRKIALAALRKREGSPLVRVALCRPALGYGTPCHARGTAAGELFVAAASPLYARRGNKPARTRSRSCADPPVGGAGFGFALAAAACLAALRAAFCQLLGRQFLCLGVDRFGRRAVKGDALVMGKHGPAVEWRHLPVGEHADRVGD